MEEVVAWAFFFFLSQAGGEGAMGFTAPFDFSSGDFFLLIHLMISTPLHISIILIFSGQQHTTLIITMSSFSTKIWSRISLVHKIQHQNQNRRLTSS
ncbi:unnamed protein product, partial [Vitis vinifera]|uniref:Uncharacterized protein n=1 Tax=Vitis vinifera TaxID=29760 RepID=D7SZ69_VITVI